MLSMLQMEIITVNVLYILKHDTRNFFLVHIGPYVLLQHYSFMKCTHPCAATGNEFVGFCQTPRSQIHLT